MPLQVLARDLDTARRSRCHMAMNISAAVLGLGERSLLIRQHEGRVVSHPGGRRPLAFAERNLYKIDDLNKAEFDLAEDKVFWDRALMEVSSHSMSMPTPRQDPCLLEVSISCELLDGTDCASFASMDCLVDVTYTYSFENVGPVPFDVARAEKQRQSVTTDLVPLLTTTELFPGETMNVLEIETIDFCVPSEILTILGGEGTATDGGLCDDAEINVIRTPGARRKRRLLRENDRG